MTVARAPRRLTRDARNQQLIECAMPVVAEEGFGRFSLEAIAERAGVTRNNLYRYFPRGRPDIVTAVVAEAGRQLLGGWITDPELSLEQRLRANMARIADHALEPSDAWRIHRQARAADQPEITQIVNDYLDAVVANIAVNNLGTPDPPPLARASILASIAFGESLLDETRGTAIPQDQIAQVILEVLVTAMHSSRPPADSPRGRVRLRAPTP